MSTLGLDAVTSSTLGIASLSVTASAEALTALELPSIPQSHP